MTLTSSSGQLAAQRKEPFIRVARIYVDSTQLESYRAALKEEIETAVRVEPGVQTLFAVYDKDHPTQVTIVEVYRDETAYRLHLQSTHFKKYKSLTKDIVISLDLIQGVPISLATKPGRNER